MAVWSFAPQNVAVEMLLDDGTILSRSGPQSVIAGQVSPDIVRAIRLTYNPVASADVRSMAAFFRARHGAYEAFGFDNPVDGRSYQVRFSETLRMDNFTPAFFASNPLTFTVVTS